MRRATRNYIVFIILLCLSLFQSVSGFIMWFALPRGGGQGRSAGGVSEATFWSLSRHTWADLHDWVAVALLIMIVIHLLMHWKWIVYITKSYFKRTLSNSGRA